MVILIDMILIILGPSKGSCSVNTCESRVGCTSSHTSHSSQCLTLSRVSLAPVSLLLQLSFMQHLRIQDVFILRMHNQLHLQGEERAALGFLPWRLLPFRVGVSLVTGLTQLQEPFE